MKREVRQRCGFGCVICGCPLFEIDHIYPYARARTHTPYNLTALCRNHHGDKTAGRLATSTVERANAHPYNKTREHSTAYQMLYDGSDVTIVIGNNRLHIPKTAPGGSAVTVNGVSLISFHRQGDNVLLCAGFRDSDGRLLLGIVDNEVVVATTTWDVVWKGAVLEIRAMPERGAVTLRLRFSMPDEIIIERLDAWHDSHHVAVGADGRLTLDGELGWGGNTFHLHTEWGTAVVIEDNAPPEQGARFGCGSLSPPKALAGGLVMCSFQPLA